MTPDWPHHIPTEDCLPDCFGCKCSTVSFDKLDQRSIDIRNRDRAFSKDNEAYRRLKKEGLQPKGVDKSALLERSADHNAEVLLGRPITKGERLAVNRGFGAI